MRFGATYNSYSVNVSSIATKTIWMLAEASVKCSTSKHHCLSNYSLSLPYESLPSGGGANHRSQFRSSESLLLDLIRIRTSLIGNSQLQSYRYQPTLLTSILIFYWRELVTHTSSPFYYSLHAIPSPHYLHFFSAQLPKFAVSSQAPSNVKLSTTLTITTRCVWTLSLF